MFLLVAFDSALFASLQFVLALYFYKRTSTYMPRNFYTSPHTRLTVNFFRFFFTLGAAAALCRGVRRWVVSGCFGQAARSVPPDRSDESMLNEEDGGIPPDQEKREQAIAKRTEARYVRDLTMR